MIACSYQKEGLGWQKKSNPQNELSFEHEMGPKCPRQCCELVVNSGVVYDRTDIDKAKMISAVRHKSKFNFKLRKKFKFLGIHCVASTLEDLSIDVLNINEGLILMKLW